MAKIRTLQAVDGEYALTGPNSTTLKQVIKKPAQAVFASFEDAAAWKEWLGIEVEWTSEKPFGVGTTRTVIANGQSIDESFLVWDEPHRIGFRFDQTTLPLAAFAEDYTLTPLSETSCELAWSYAYEWSGPLGRFGERAFGFFFSRMGKRSLRKLARMMKATDRFDQ